jgi:uncharacterized protein
MIDIILYVSALALLILGIVGAFLPVLPGPPLSYIGILLIHFSSKHAYTNEFLWTYGIVMVVITVADYILPFWGTKKFGGTKYGMWGAAIGLLLGLIIYAPIGIFVGPFVGAYLAELINDKKSKEALRSAFGSFLGIVFGVFLKFVFAIVMLFNGIWWMIASFF